MTSDRLTKVLLILIAIPLWMIAIVAWQNRALEVSLYSQDLEGIEQQLGQIESALEHLRH